MNTPARPAEIVSLDGEILPAPNLGTLATAEVSQQISTAKAFPRSIERFRKQVLALATLNEEVAAQCLFALPRGGKVIEGPSIRFAEIVVAAWGNCRVASQVVGEDGSFVKSSGLFWDLETNSAIGFEVRRPIVYSKTHKIERLRGQRFDEDMIAVTGNAASAIARRNATLGGIPKALWWDLYLEAKRAAVGDVQTLASRRAKAIEALKKYGVTEAQIFDTLGIAGINELDLDKLATLRGFYTAITAEEKDPEEIFKPAVTKDARPERQAAPSAPAIQQQKPAPPPAPDGAPAPDPIPPASNSEAGAAGSEAPAPEQEVMGAPAAGDRGYSELLESFTGALIDARTPKEVEAVNEMYAPDFANADGPTQALAKQAVAERRATLLAAIEADDFPGDRPMGGEG